MNLATCVDADKTGFKKVDLSLKRFTNRYIKLAAVGKGYQYTGWPQSHALMLIKKVIVITFIQIQSSLQGLQMLDMFAVCSYARANTKFKVPVVVTTIIFN